MRDMACRYFQDLSLGFSGALNPVAAANPLMANRVFDEATLLRAAAILQQQQQQQNLVAQAALLAIQQGGTPDRSMSQVPVIPLARSAAAAQHLDSAASSSQPREPGRVQFPGGSARAAAPSGASNSAPQNLKQERTAQNFLRGCARLRMIQVRHSCPPGSDLACESCPCPTFCQYTLLMMQTNADRRRQRRACCLRTRIGGRTSPGA